MSKTAQKQHMKKHLEYVISKSDGSIVNEIDYRLHKIYGKNCSNPRMFWINCKNHEDSFPKIKGDMVLA